MTNTKVLARPHTITVGKEGVTDAINDEMKRQIKKHHVIRVQLNAAVAGGKQKVVMKKMLAEKLHAKVLHAVGFVVILEKR